MSMNRFDRAFECLKVHEGGYVNHPDDPGGATNKGVTQRTYNHYRRRHDKDTRDVRQITNAEVRAIYLGQFWSTIDASNLPAGVAYCVFDAAVNSGPGQAVRWLQRVIGAKVDGVVGMETLTKTKEMDPATLIDAYCDRRLAFMQRLAHWDSFGDGWTRRVDEVRAQSKEWAETGQITTETTNSPQPKAEGEQKLSSTARDFLRDKPAVTAVGGAVSSLAPMTTGNGPIQYALAVVLVIVALTAVWFLFIENETRE